MFGSAAGYLSELLAQAGISSEEIRGNRDPLFGGQNPEPLPDNLVELISLTREAALKDPKKITVGLALDGDGDRIGAVGQNGAFISPHCIFAILLKHLVENKKMKGEVVKTFNITNLIPLTAKKYGLLLHETPIGFKYICELMLERDILIGGEESGGIGIKGNIPERDSPLACLLLLEAMAAWGKPLDQILEEIMNELGHFYYNRADLHLAEEKKARVMEKLKISPPKRFAGLGVVDIQTLDGVKFVLDDLSWILFRPSGTEPLLRIYCEATSPERLNMILGEGEKLAEGA
jgi:phosphomannomutase